MRGDNLAAKDGAHIVKRKRRRFTWDDLELTLLSFPTIAWLIAFCYVPMFGIVFAFKNYKYKPGKGFLYSLFVSSKWVGLKNFEFFFSSQDAVRTIGNTLMYSVSFLIIDLVAAVVLAWMLYYLRSRIATKFYNTVVIIPKFMSMVIVAYIVYAILSPTYGLLNQIITRLGGTGINWYAEPKYWPLILTVTHVWQTVGMNCVLYYSSLMSMDNALVEAAEMDGANRLQQIRHVVIPHLVPIMVITTILSIGSLFSSSLDLFYQIPKNQGLLYSTTDTINTYVYRALLEGSLEKSAAINLFQSAVGFVLVVGTNAIVKKISPENSLF